ncbi:MAG: FAD-dependent oxidoreductase [Lachnospiraceae bacterium]|nr:FAD-dependent oxidoreductase [Lachnospiraceae bacterium]
MKSAVVIGAGISGMSCAIDLARAGVRVMLISPFSSERSQSVMAAGGINAVLPGAENENGDSVASHMEDTIKGGSYLGGKKAVKGLCENAGEIIRYLEGIGTVFSLDGEGKPDKRAFGGQSYKRTFYCGASTGKQIVTAMIMEVRRYEATGLIDHRLWMYFHSALIEDSVCHGVLLFNEITGKLEAVLSDAVVMATGGQNRLFGKTTGSTQCDGYAVSKLFTQGAELKNLEFIQYHPTSIETTQKKMLISEAVRGEGGRLFYEENGKRVYFMEDKYGPRGNLMTRDVVSREMDAAKRDIFLDISFLGKEEIERRIPEVRDLCLKYRGLDISRESIPVSPAVHFFMGGLAVHLNHETCIRNLFAVGECASMYHGANRLGGNSLLAAVYSGKVAAKEIAERKSENKTMDYSTVLERESRKLDELRNNKSSFPVAYMRDMIANTMNEKLGIVRNKESLEKGIEDMDYYLSAAEKISYDKSVLMYENYSITGLIILAKAIIISANERKESRGSHFRSDYPETDENSAYATIISYDEGRYKLRQDREHFYED